MATPIIIYGGCALYEWGRGYKSEINGEWVTFDSAAQWKKYIDLILYGKKA